MASNNQEEVCVTVTWKIQNFGLLLREGPRSKSPWYTEMDPLFSPLWKVKHTEGSSSLKRLVTCHWSPYLFFGLFDQKTKLPVHLCEMTVLSSRGEVRLEGGSQYMFYIERDAIFGAKRRSELLKDTLIVRCRMWEKTTRKQQISLSSVLRNMSLEWNFQHWKKFHLECFFEHKETIEKDNMVFDVVVGASGSSRFKVMVEAIPNADSWHSFVRSKAVTIRSRSPGEWSHEYNYMHTISRQSIEIPVQKEFDSYYFQLESIIALHDGNQLQLPQYSVSGKPVRVNQGQLAKYTKADNALSEDLLHLYREALHTDTTLTAEGHSMPAHKSILAARSPVFRAMFQDQQTSEAQSGIVEIDDVDSCTLDRMLCFLYGGVMPGLIWEQASALYYAADKYDIRILKRKCAEVLKAGLTTDNACDALVLAERHSDVDLKDCIVEFIFNHQEVLSSSQWDIFEERNLRLAAKILRDIVFKKGK